MFTSLRNIIFGQDLVLSDFSDDSDEATTDAPDNSYVSKELSVLNDNSFPFAVRQPVQEVKQQKQLSRKAEESQSNLDHDHSTGILGMNPFTLSNSINTVQPLGEMDGINKLDKHDELAQPNSRISEHPSTRSHSSTLTRSVRQPHWINLDLVAEDQSDFSGIWVEGESLTQTSISFRDLRSFDPTFIPTIMVEAREDLLSTSEESLDSEAWIAASATQPERSESLAIARQGTPVTALGVGRDDKSILGPAQVYLAQAERFCQEQKWSQAIAACQDALTISPTLAKGYKVWGNILQHMGETTEAMGYYAKALVLDPNYPEVYANLGSLYAKQEQWDEAIFYYQKAIEFNPSFAGAFRNLAKIWHRLNQVENEMQCLFCALSLDSKFGTVAEYYKLGNYFFEQGKQAEAIQAYQAVLELNPNDEKTCNRLAELLEQQGDWQSAVKYCRKVIEMREAQSQTRVKKQKTDSPLNLTRLAEQPVSIKAASTAVDQKSTSPLSNEASSKQATSQIKTLIQSAQKQPDSDSIRIELGDAYARKHLWDKAADAYKSALRLNPTSAKTYLKLGKVCAKAGKQAESAESYHRAFELDETLATDQYHRALGQSFSSLGQIEKAIAHYRKALKLNPSHTHLYRDLAKLYTQDGQIDRATHCWYQMIRRGDEWATPSRCVKVGDAYYAQQDSTKAMHCYRQALKLDPTLTSVQTKINALLNFSSAKTTSPQSHTLAINSSQVVSSEKQQESFNLDAAQRAMSYHKQGAELAEREQWNEAIQAYRRSIQLNPDFPWSYHNLGDVLKTVGKWDEAIQSYRQALRLNPDSPWTFYNLGDVFAEKDYWKQATECYSQAFKIDPSLTGLLKKLAQSLQNTSKADHERALELYSEAIHQGVEDEAVFHRVIESQLGDAEVYAKYGEFLYKNKRLDEAIFLYQTASKIDPKNVEIRLTLCNVLCAHHQLSNAILSCQTALQDIPNSSVLNLKMGSLLIQNQEFEPALDYLKRSLTIESDCIEAQMLLAQTLHHLGNRDAAYSAYLELGEMICRQGDLDQALGAFQKCVDIDPNKGWGYNCLGNVFFWKNEFDSAIQYYEQAIKLLPNLAGAYKNLGNAYSAKGNVDEAAKFYAIALQKE